MRDSNRDLATEEKLEPTKEARRAEKSEENGTMVRIPGAVFVVRGI